MPSIKDLKKRIVTVKNTQQTTKAMKMVSAAKLRRAQEAIQSQRPYAKQIGNLIRKLVVGIEANEGNPLLQKQRIRPEGEKKKVLLVLVTSDRGLCGGFNGNVIKTCQRWMKAPENQGVDIQLAFLGKKGNDFFKTKSVSIAGYYPELGGKVTFLKAKKAATALVDLYTSGQVDEVKFIYNEFKNAVTQKVLVEDFLPLNPSDVTEASAEDAESQSYLIRPSLAEVVQELLSKHFAIQAFRIMLESQAGEHGARMSAMENATKNAGEMIRKLTLQYNKQRQAGITKELLEIISGSESQKG